MTRKKKPEYRFIREKKGNILFIYDPIFKINYYYICCPTHKRFREILGKEVKITGLAEKKGTSGGCVVTYDSGEVCCIWTNKKCAGLVAHEVLHALTMLIRAGHKIEFNDHTEEMYCLAMEYAVKAIMVP